MLILLGVTIIYAGYTYLSWGWNLLVIPIGLFLSISGYKNMKKSKFQVADITFRDDSVLITYVNGEQKSVKNEKLIYAILAKRFIQPVRAIEFREKGKIGLSKGKKIGGLYVSKWPNLDQIATHLIQNEFSRRKWSFGWSFGEILMVFSLLLGLTESMAESYVGEINSGLDKDVNEIGELIDDEIEKRRDSHQKAEKDFIEKSQKPNKT